MADPRLDDLRAIDADVARAAVAIERWRARAATDPDAAEEDDPFLGLRHVTAKSTRDALRERPVSLADELLRRGLVRWLGVLIQARVGLPDDLARAQAENAKAVHHEGDEPKTETWREGWRDFVAARTPDEARRWLRSLADAAPPRGAAARAASARRLEVARRLGYAHPWDVEDRAIPGGRVAVVSAARALLDATEDVAQAHRREVARDGADAASVLYGTMARSAGDGWPARLTAQWFDDVFRGGPRGLPIRLPSLPRAVGAASFARALADFGRAVRLATTPRALPFAVARDPWNADGHAMAALFASLAADPEFHVRALGTGRRVGAAQARSLAGTLLVEVRLSAARVLLGDDERPAPSDVFEEVTARVFGAAADSRFAGAWPWSRDDEPERLIALLGVRGARETLRDRHDVDWFRNPRAWEQLRAPAIPRLEPPPADAELPPWDRDAAALARAFEEAFG
jgi:hypothetical protein